MNDTLLVLTGDNKPVAQCPSSNREAAMAFVRKHHKGVGGITHMLLYIQTTKPEKLETVCTELLGGYLPRPWDEFTTLDVANLFAKSLPLIPGTKPPKLAVEPKPRKKPKAARLHTHSRFDHAMILTPIKGAKMPREGSIMRQMLAFIPPRGITRARFIEKCTKHVTQPRATVPMNRNVVMLYLHRMITQKGLVEEKFFDSDEF